MGDLIPVMMLFDMAGLVFRWSTFDHAAHLSGAVFGFAYVSYGPSMWADWQRYFLEQRKK